MLTAKQEKFAFNVAIKGMTYHDAYIDAYNTNSMKPAVIDVNASKLASHAKVSLRIKEKRNELEGPDKMGLSEMLHRLTEVGRAKMVDYLDEHGQPIIKETQAISEYTVKPGKYGYQKAIKLNDPLQAMRDIAKLKGWWKDEGNTTIINVDKVMIDARITLESKINSLVARLGTGEVSQESE